MLIALDKNAKEEAPKSLMVDLGQFSFQGDMHTDDRPSHSPPQRETQQCNEEFADQQEMENQIILYEPQPHQGINFSPRWSPRLLAKTKEAHACT